MKPKQRPMKPCHLSKREELAQRSWLELDDLLRAARRLVQTTEMLNPDYTREQARRVALYAVWHMDEMGVRGR